MQNLGALMGQTGGLPGQMAAASPAMAMAGNNAPRQKGSRPGKKTVAQKGGTKKTQHMSKRTAPKKRGKK